MGIKGLRDVLREQAPKGLPWISLSKFSGGRVAIDVSHRVCISLHTVYNILLNRIAEPPLDGKLDLVQVTNMLIGRLADDAIRFLNLGITPIFVFDGMVHPAKEGTREGRKSSRQNIRLKLDEMLARRRELKANWNPSYELENEELCKQIKKLMAQVAYLGENGYDMIKSWLYLCGLPYLIAKYEAEKLAALLTTQGEAKAVLSGDGDCLAFGSYCTIFSGFEGVQISGGRTNYVVQVMDLQIIMQQLQLQFPQLVDWCIMSGTDFNQNIKRVGCKTALKYFRQYGTLENIYHALNTKHDFSVLNVDLNREIFKIIPWQEYILYDETRDRAEQLRLDIAPFEWTQEKELLTQAFQWDTELFGLRIYLQRPLQPLSPSAMHEAESAAQSTIIRNTEIDMDKIRQKLSKRRGGAKSELSYDPQGPVIINL